MPFQKKSRSYLSAFSVYRISTLLTLLLLVFGCDTTRPQDSGLDVPLDVPSTVNACELPQNQIVSGGPGKDGIPALSDPVLVSANEVPFLSDNDRVIGMMVDGRPVAVPHNVLWWHEIVNFNTASQRVAATYCPLTGSSIVFDRSNVGNAELGVSGLLYQNNLIMYDRNSDEALWSQILTGASCDSEKGVSLETVAHVEMDWAGWKSLYPNTEVISSETGFSRDYTRYPYGTYEEENNTRLLFQMRALDSRRPPKERVLGIPDRDGSVLAFPFGMLDSAPKNLIETQFKGLELVVLWDREKRAATAFQRVTTDGVAVDLSVVSNQFVDEITGAVFEVNGRVLEGELAGTALRPIPQAYVAFWFAWPAFHPEVVIYTPAT